MQGRGQGHALHLLITRPWSSARAVAALCRTILILQSLGNRLSLRHGDLSIVSENIAQSEKAVYKNSDRSNFARLIKAATACSGFKEVGHSGVSLVRLPSQVKGR
jgi:hypothetical protein